MAGICLLLLMATSYVLADLKVDNRKPCGEFFCASHEYCTDVDQLCRKCSNICEADSHNRQDRLCEAQCQDYLHDSRYQKVTDYGDGIYAQIQKLQIISTLALIISLILSCILLLIATYWVKTQKLTWLQKYKKPEKSVPNNEKLKIQIDPNHEPTIATIPIPEETSSVLVDAVRSNGLATPHTEYTHLSTFKATPETPSSGCTNKSLSSLQKSRFPSEDDTFAYDNLALTPSPILDKAAAAVRKGGDTVTVRT